MRLNEQLIYRSDTGAEVIFAPDRFKTPYWWDDADGLDGIANDIYSMRAAGQDGTTLTGKNLRSRYIYLSGKVSRDFDRARRDLIRAVNPKNSGRLIYSDGDTITRWIPCEVERAPVLSRDSVARWQVQFYCPYPYWRQGDGSSQSVTDIALWVPMFEFDMDDGLQIDGAEGIEIGQRSQSLIVNVLNQGDVPAGITVEFRALGTTANPSLINVQTQEYISLTTALLAGDIIRISTGYGEKRAERERGGVITNVFNSINAGSTFLQLAAGDNLLRYDADEPDNIEVRIYFDAAYLGV